MTSPSCVSILYGPPKKMKSSIGLACYPTGLWFGDETAIRAVAEGELGFTPSIDANTIETLPQLLALLRSYGPETLQKFGAVCIDDLSLRCLRSVQLWKRNAPLGKKGKPDGFYPYIQLGDNLLDLTAFARYAGVHVLFICHERQPGTNARDEFTQGGPEFGSSSQVGRVPGWCDVNLRAVASSEYEDPFGVKVHLWSSPFDPVWQASDRNGVAFECTPPSLREILRASRTPYALHRLPGLEWQDEAADLVAGVIAEGGTMQAAAEEAKAAYRDKNQLHIRWACQEGFARGILRVRGERNLFDFSATTGGAPPPPPPT